MPRYERSVGTSAADTSKTQSVGGDLLRKLHQVTVKYSAAPTQAGVTVTLNSGAGAAYDAVLSTGSANAQTTTYVPEKPIVLLADDFVDVFAPAGGGVITSAISIYTEVF